LICAHAYSYLQIVASSMEKRKPRWDYPAPASTIADICHLMLKNKKASHRTVHEKTSQRDESDEGDHPPDENDTSPPPASSTRKRCQGSSTRTTESDSSTKDKRQRNQPIGNSNISSRGRRILPFMDMVECKFTQETCACRRQALLQLLAVASYDGHDPTLTHAHSHLVHD
jgi:hypothetical protein